MLGKVFKAYDVRATYPKPLNEKLAWQIGYGTAQYLMEHAEKAGHDDPNLGLPCACELPIPPAIATSRRPPA